MRHQFRASNDRVMHMQTTADTLALHCPGADPLHLTVEDIDRLMAKMAEAKRDLAQSPRGWRS